MKLEKKTKRLIALATIALIAFTTVAFAAYWIYSTTVQVKYTPTQYTLTLDGQQINDTTIELNATLTVLHFNATQVQPVSDATIHFYLTKQDETIIQDIGTAKTDNDGVAIFDWTVPAPTSNATIYYYFKAGYEVTP
jgi:diacylglycerol kinase family enzyme